MIRPFAMSLLSMIVPAGAVLAQAPQVATDIAPIHSLVAKIMEGVGAPALVVRQGSSPHGYSMRPSEARALQDADLVVWVGPELAPWFEKSLTSLAEDSVRLELLDVEGVLKLDFRDLADDHDDNDGHDDHDGDEDHAKHDDHDDHESHDDHDDHDDHGDHDDHAEHDDHSHHHDGVDPHAWLDPQNAQIWLAAIADQLAEINPENAELYRRNAENAIEDLKLLEADLAGKLNGLKEQHFVAFHDAYQYFENRFNLTMAGTITLGDASDPSPARLAALRNKIAEYGVNCAFAEPQFDQRLLKAAVESGDLEIRVIDPLGSRFETGPELYPQLITDMAAEFAACDQ